MTNDNIASRLQQQARILAASHDNLYRIRAYRQAAMAILRLDRPVVELSESDLESLSGIGSHLALAIAYYARTGDWKTFEELTSNHLAV